MKRPPQPGSATRTTDSPIWRPAPARAAASHMARFARIHAPAAGHRDYAALHRWSVESPAAFWAAFATYAEIPFLQPADTVLENPDRMPGAAWFKGATLNFASALLEHDTDGIAIEFSNERGDRESITWQALRDSVRRTAHYLDAAGIGPGDRVAGILPNRPETIVAALACAAVGAVWASCSPDFGASALLDRLGQVEPKCLFGTAAYVYNGRTIDCLPTLRGVAGALPTVERTVIVPYAAPEPSLDGLPAPILFDDMPATDAPAIYRELPFDHPLYILFSSGTTGAPKCIVHGAGGTLLQHRKEHLLHTDLQAGERLFFFTTCGWMMWNWLVSALASRVTLVLYDGSPFHPDPGVLWRMADTLAVDVFGTSAKYLSALEHSGYRPAAHRADTGGHVRAILSTGSPLAPASFRFVADHIDPSIQVASIAGGTDIVSCFMLGNPELPVYEGEIQCLGLGMDVRIFDSDGNEVSGGKGELVCARPFPSMPVGFLNDPDGGRYRAAYFERFPGVWHHGDYAERTDHGGVIIHGRSDAVLNPGGVRIGTAEIYRIVENLPEIEEAVAIGQAWKGDTRIVLAVRIAGTGRLDDTLKDRIRSALRTACSPRHVPAVIIAVDAIPKTINGKVSELAVRDVVHGRQVSNLGALANPESLDAFRNRAELEA